MKNSKLILPLLGFGTWSGIWGRKDRPTFNPSAIDQGVTLIQSAIKFGLKNIDTAEMYGNGYAEELIGCAVSQIDRRLVFLTSKVNGNRLTRQDVISAAKSSLYRLKMDYINLYLVHWFESNDVLVEIISALDDLVEQGLVANIGVSNFDVNQLIEAQKLSRHAIAANQVEYNLLNLNYGKTKYIHSQMLPFCNENKISVIAYNPLAGGKLATAESFPLLSHLSKKYGCSCAQIAIRWLIQHDNLSTICGTSRTDHLLEISKVLDFEMEEEDHVMLTREALHAEYNSFYKS